LYILKNLCITPYTFIFTFFPAAVLYFSNGFSTSCTDENLNNSSVGLNMNPSPSGSTPGDLPGQGSKIDKGFVE
jgi:hypothetical protein